MQAQCKHTKEENKLGTANATKVWPKHGTRKVKIRHCHTLSVDTSFCTWLISFSSRSE